MNKNIFSTPQRIVIKDKNGCVLGISDIPFLCNKNNTINIELKQKISKGDTVKILQEPFVNIQGKIVDQIELMGKYLVKIDEQNALYIDKDKVELVKKKVEKKQYTTNMRIPYSQSSEEIVVTIRGKRTSVKLKDETEASVYDVQEGVRLAYCKAKEKQFKNIYNVILNEIR